MSPASALRQQRALLAALCCTLLVQHLSAAGPTTLLDYKLTLKWWEATRHGFLEYSVQPSQVLAHTEELKLQWINFLDASSPTWMLDIAGFEAQQREFSVKPSRSGKSMDVVLKLDLDTRATNYARWAPAGRRTFPTHLRVDLRMTGRLTDSGSTEGSKVRHSNGALVCTYKVTEDLYEFHDLVVTANGVAINGTSLVEKFQTGTLSVKKTTIAPASWS